jgi:ABC-2 type transport system ATP-binding protein
VREHVVHLAGEVLALAEGHRLSLGVAACLELLHQLLRARLPEPELARHVAHEEEHDRARVADDRATKLSGGQRRRLDVALALIGDPELIFLDEPTTGFDPAARRRTWEVIGGLRALGKTILLTTHYMEEAERLADRIVVMAYGRIVADGTPATLGGRDRAAAIVSFSLPAGAGEPPLGATVDDRGRVALRTQRPMSDLHELTGWALARELELTDLEVRRPTLEDVYLELTHE